MHFLKSLIIFSFCFAACGEPSSSSESQTESATKHSVLVKVFHKDEPNQISNYSAPISYHWVVGTDTLDFAIYVSEHLQDKTLHLSYSHKLPILLQDAAVRTARILPIINEDFGGKSIKSLYLKTPVYYLDLATNLYDIYQAEYKDKSITQPEEQAFFEKSLLHEFMVGLGAHTQMRPISYSLEKFHVMKKAGYSSYLPDTNLDDYPEFTIGGIGLHIFFEEIKQ